MIRFFFLHLFIFASQMVFAQNTLTEIKVRSSNPGHLKMFIHIPKHNRDSLKQMPLVVALHGCTQNANEIAVQSDWNKLADYYGFYVLYPQQNFLNNPNECFDWFNKNDIEKNKGEVYSIKQMIDFVIDTFSIDTTRIFAYGLSAGAAMSVALLADYPYLFSAGAILAGGPYMAATNPTAGLVSMTSPKNKTSKQLGEVVLKQNPDYKGKYPKIIIVHGKKDPVVNIKNSYQLIQQ